MSDYENFITLMKHTGEKIKETRSHEYIESIDVEIINLGVVFCFDAASGKAYHIINIREVD